MHRIQKILEDIKIPPNLLFGKDNEDLKKKIKKYPMNIIKPRSFYGFLLRKTSF